MKSVLRFTFLFLVFAFNYSFTQTLHNVALVGSTFSPSDLTISVGDTVRWTNNGGFHSVQADDNSFSSGSPSSASWVFIHVFNTEGDFRYYCAQHGGPNGSGMSGIIHVTGATDVDDNAAKMDFVLKQNYPNPFNPTTRIEYSISKTVYVTLKIYNVMGTLEKTIVSKNQTSGNYTVELDASDLASGVYFYQLIAGDFMSVKRMILLK